jgi:hypothetical protein
LHHHLNHTLLVRGSTQQTLQRWPQCVHGIPSNTLCALWKQLRDISPRARETATVTAGDGRGQIYCSRLGRRCLTFFFFFCGVGGRHGSGRRWCLVEWNGGGGSQLFSFLSAQDEPRRRRGSPTLDPDAVLIGELTPHRQRVVS